MNIYTHIFCFHNIYNLDNFHNAPHPPYTCMHYIYSVHTHIPTANMQPAHTSSQQNCSIILAKRVSSIYIHVGKFLKYLMTSGCLELQFRIWSGSFVCMDRFVKHGFTVDNNWIILENTTITVSLNIFCYTSLRIILTSPVERV